MKLEKTRSTILNESARSRRSLADAATQEKSRRRDAERRLGAARNVQETSEKQLARLAAEVADRDSQIEELKSLNVELQKNFEKVDRWLIRRREDRWMALKGLAVVVTSLLLLFGGSAALSSYVTTGLAWSACTALTLLVLLVGVERCLRDTHLAHSKFYTRVKSLRRAWRAFAIAVAASLIAAWINESFL